METNKNNGISEFQESDSINIKEEIGKYLIYWKWFVFGMVLAMGAGFTHLRYTTPQYTAFASILIKDNQKSGISKELEAFKDLGIIGGSSSNNPDNEIEILKSRKIVGNVVDSLQLNISYFIEGRVKKTEIYREAPFLLKLDKSDLRNIKKDTAFTILHTSGANFVLKNLEGNEVSKHTFGEVIQSKIGEFSIVKNKKSKQQESKEVFVVVSRRNAMIDSYRARINIFPFNKESSILLLSLKDPVNQKTEDVLNELIKQYNIDAIKNKNEISQKTKNFIDKRLKKIWIDLALAQDKVKEYKSENKISGLSKEGDLILEAFSRNNEKNLATQSQLLWAQTLKEKLQEETEKDDILPVNLGFQDASITTAITVFNELIFRRNVLNVNAGKRNPKLLEIESQIASLKTNLKSSFDNLVSSLKLQLRQQSKESSKITSRISSMPNVERDMIDILREKEIYSVLYSYLLRKKEEISISLAVTVANAKIIDDAYSNGLPVSPNRKITLLLSLLLGVLVPFVIVYLKYLLDTKIHSKKEVTEKTSIPFIGSVPTSDSKEKIIIGKENSRSSVAEAFRLIRTNLSFMIPTSEKTDEGKTIFVTSTISGEGKSFISLNLAFSLSLYNKKVLLLGMDLRVPKITQYLNVEERKGLTNYITRDDVTLEDMVFSIPNVDNLDIISSGVVPPNPAELLLNDKVGELFDKVKKEYDYIVVDTAPVNLVTDTLLISKYADLFLYVVRANYLDKRMLEVSESLYVDKKLPNMAMVLNDVNMKRGYGYGYSYGYTEEVEKPWYQKIFNKN